MHKPILINIGQGHTVKELLELHIGETLLRPDSIKSYRSAANVFIHYCGNGGDDIYLTDITKELTLQWRQKVLETHAPTSWNSYRTRMCSLFNHGVAAGWIEQNPLRHVKTTRVGRRPKRTLSYDQRKTIVDFIEKIPDYPGPGQTGHVAFMPGWFWLALFKTLYFTGMRRRQLVNLRWKDINFNTGVMRLSLDGSKTNQEWSIPMLPTLDEQLQIVYGKTLEITSATEVDLMNRQVFAIGLFNPKYHATNSLGEIYEDQISGFFGRLSKHLGFRITAHGMRHTFATELMRAPNPDIKAIQELLGHSHIRMTLQYMETNMQQLRRSTNSLPPL